MTRTLTPRGASLAERLAMCSQPTPTGCREWTRLVDKDGYGRITIDGRDTKAHRAAYELEHGPLPPDVLVRHSCDNPPCIELSHLLSGDAVLNAEDRVQRSRFNKSSSRYNRVKLDMDAAREIRRRHADGVTPTALASEYGVGRDQISRVLNHLNWKEPAAMTITISDAIARTGVEVLDHLDRSAEVPVVSGLQRQGDVIVVPHAAGQDKGTQIPPDGIAVVRGEAGGNTHALVADGPCTWAPRDLVTAASPDLGTLTVNEGSTAFLAHPEHGFLAIGPGQYNIRRQVEETDRRQLVAD